MGNSESVPTSIREEQRHSPAQQEVTWQFLRGHPPLEILDLPKVAVKRFSTRSTNVAPEASAARNVFPCFRAGLLFRIDDKADGTWHFYNDTNDMEMHVEYHFGPQSVLDISQYVTVSASNLPGCEGFTCASMIVFPGETLPFVTGASRPNGFRSVYRIAPLSDNISLRQDRETAALKYRLTDEMEIVAKLTMEMEEPTEDEVVERCARQTVPFVDLGFQPTKEAIFGSGVNDIQQQQHPHHHRQGGAALSNSPVNRAASANKASAAAAATSSSRTSVLLSSSSSASFAVKKPSASRRYGSSSSASGGGGAAQDSNNTNEPVEYHGDAADLHRRLPPVVWMRPKHFLPRDEAEETTCVGRGVDVLDIEQGFLGDTWLQCAIAGLAEYPETIEWIFRDSVPLNPSAAASVAGGGAAASSANASRQQHQHHDKQLVKIAERNVGAYRVCINVNGWWTSIVLDDYLPCIGSRPAFASNRRDRRELWPALLQKCFAKMYGSYAALIAGDPLLAWRTLTGCPTTRFDTDWQQAVERGTNDADVVEGFFHFILECRASGYLVCLNTRGVDDTFSHDLSDGNQQLCQQVVNKFESIGLALGHSYAVLDAHYFAQWKLFLLKFRNAFGSESGREWAGNWSDRSEMWERFPDVAAVCKPEVKDDGIFWMSWEDAVQYFQGGGVCFWRPHAALRVDHRVMGHFVDSLSNVCIELRVQRKTTLTFVLSQHDSVGRDAMPLAAMMLSIAAPRRVDAEEDGTTTTSGGVGGGDAQQKIYEVRWNSTTDPQHPTDAFTFTFARDLGIVIDLEPEDEPYLIVPRVFDAGVNKPYVLAVIASHLGTAVANGDGAGAAAAGETSSPIDMRFVHISGSSDLYLNRRYVQYPPSISRPALARFQIKTALGVTEGAATFFDVPASVVPAQHVHQRKRGVTTGSAAALALAHATTSAEAAAAVEEDRRAARREREEASLGRATGSSAAAAVAAAAAAGGGLTASPSMFLPQQSAAHRGRHGGLSASGRPSAEASLRDGDGSDDIGDGVGSDEELSPGGTRRGGASAVTFLTPEDPQRGGARGPQREL